MNRNNKFWQQQNKKKNVFYNKNKKIFNIDDIGVNKILVFKKEQYSTLLDIMIMMLYKKIKFENYIDEELDSGSDNDDEYI